MKLKELINRQENCTGFKLYIDDKVNVYADTEYMRELMKIGDDRGEYKVIKFLPKMIEDTKGSNRLFMCVYTSSKL